MEKVDYVKQSRKVIRKRNTDDRRHRPCAVRIRATKSVSSSLASIQGLCYAYGGRETIADLFEKVAMPAFRSYVAEYAQKARQCRQERSAKSGGRNG